MAEPDEQRNTSQRLPETRDSSLKKMNTQIEYGLAIREIVKKIRRGALLPPITPQELDGIVTDWVEVLGGIVPQDKLNESYLAAKQSPARDPRKLLTDTELLAAYYSLRAAETPTGPKPCEFCRMHAYDPSQFPPCTFHPICPSCGGRMDNSNNSCSEQFHPDGEPK